MPISVEPLQRSEVRDCARMLGRAFLDNPATLALIPESSEGRARVLRRVMRGFVEATLIAGRAYSVREDGRMGGAMLAYAPACFPPRPAAMAWLAYGPLSGGPRTAYRYALADAYLRRLHPRIRHWYLFVLGVDPELQGRGLGGALLRRLAGEANRDRVPCYLETDKASSVRLYERHGFRVDHEETEPRLGVRFWTMTRPVTAAPF